MVRFPAWRAIPWTAWLVLVAGTGVVLHHLLAVFHFVQARSLEGDFALYYVFARIGLRHGWPALYDLAAQRQEWSTVGHTLFYPEIYPPPLGWLVAPFALLPLSVAIWIWTGLLVGALLLTWWLCAPAGRPAVRAAHLVVALALPPVAFAVLLGQVVPFVALAVAGCWWLLRRDRPLTGGLLLAALAVKPQLAFLVPLALLAGGRWRAVAGWAAGSAAIGVVAGLTVGIDGLHAYVTRLVASTHSLGSYVVPVEVTLPGLLGSGALAHIGQLSAIVLMVVACWRRGAPGPEFPIAAGVCASLVVTPFYHPQDLAVLLPAAWLTLRMALPAPERRLALAGYLSSGLLATPLPLLLVMASWGLTLARKAPRVSVIPSAGFGTTAQARRS